MNKLNQKKIKLILLIKSNYIYNNKNNKTNSSFKIKEKQSQFLALLHISTEKKNKLIFKIKLKFINNKIKVIINKKNI